ncbi:unnamed protein product [Caenorhabditis nigoni]
MLLPILLLISTISLVEAGKFTPNKYELELTPEFFGDNSFTGKAKIHVDVTGSVEEFDLQVSKDLEVKKVIFWAADAIYRGNPNLKGGTATFKKDGDKIHVTLLGAITKEDIKIKGFIEIAYKGKAGKKGASKGLFLINDNDYGTNLKNGNAIYLFPILEDVAAPLTLSVITPYRAGVETKLKVGDHKSVEGEELISNNFNSGAEKIKVSNLEFKVNAPRVLILDSN